jgi:hypothetical protein
VISPLADLLLGFGAGLAIFLAPLTLAAAMLPAQKRPDFDSLGPLVLLNAGAYFCACVLLSRFIPHGPIHFSLAVLAACACSALAARGLAAKRPAESMASLGGATVAVVLLATLGILDTLYVYANQSWGIDGRIANVVSPMQLDPQRNTNLSTALLRGSDTVFLPGSRILYQLFWYHGSAGVLSVLPESVTRYYQTAGFALATGWLLYAALLWVALRVSPTILSRPIILIFLGTLILFDTRLDDTGLMQALYKTLYPSGVPTPYFQYFSLKLLALTAPQHALFFVFFLGMAYFRIVAAETRMLRLPLWVPLCVLSVLSSPVLAAFVFPVYFLAESLFWLRKGWKEVGRQIGVVALAALAAAALHYALLGFSIHELFTRGGAVDLKFFSRGDGRPPFRVAPLVFVLSSGLLGAVFTALVALWLLAPKKFIIDDPVRRWVAVFLGSSLAGVVLWNFVVSEVELRRHFSMALALCTSLVILALLPRLSLASHRRGMAVAALGIAAFAFLLDYRFVRSHSAHRYATVSTDIAWRDYFQANEFLRQNRPNANVIAASGEGIVLPVANEVATALAPKLAILAHQKVTPQMRDFLSIEADKGGFSVSDINPEWVSLARKLGFDTVVWGPVEESIWGYFGREVLLAHASLKGEYGEVLVFELGARDGTDDAARQRALGRVACDADIRRRLRSAGHTVVFEGERYHLSDLGGGTGGSTLRELWSNMGNAECRSDELLASPVRPRAASVSRGGRNLAIGAKSRQSSTSAPDDEHGAWNGNDGQMDGVIRGVTKIAHTARERRPWWQVDLGKSTEIESVQVWGKHPSFARRLTNVSVIVSENDPAKSADGATGAMRIFRVPGMIRDGDIIPVRSTGRFVRLELAGEGYFVASEVQVWAH